MNGNTAWQQSGQKPNGVGRPRVYADQREYWREKKRRYRSKLSTKIREIEVSA